MPPEAHLQDPLTTAADVYQLGGVCFFMAMGYTPPGPLQPAHSGALQHPLIVFSSWTEAHACALTLQILIFTVLPESAWAMASDAAE